MGMVGRRGGLLGLVLLGMTCVPTVVLAQAGFYVTPSFSFGEVYDDNIFSTASKPESDFITRFTPTIQAGYQSKPLTVLGRYTFDSEIYPDHPDLTNAQVRQRASAELTYLPIRPLTLAVNGSYAETQTPSELNVLTELQVGRSRASSLSLAPSVAYQFDPLTTGTGGYTFSRSELSGGVSTDTHAMNLGLDRRITPQDTGNLGYTFRHFVFGGSGTSAGEDTITSHVLTLGWTRELTPLLSVTLRGGPRFSEGSVAPEVSASIRYKLKSGGLLFTYARSQTTSIGEARTLDTESFTASVSYQFLRLLQLSAAPSFSRNSSEGSDVNVYRLSLGATYQITEWLSLVGSYQFSLQQGSFTSTTGTPGSPDQEISHNIVVLRLVATYPYRVY